MENEELRKCRVWEECRKYTKEKEKGIKICMSGFMRSVENEECRNYIKEKDIKICMP